MYDLSLKIGLVMRFYQLKNLIENMWLLSIFKVRFSYTLIYLRLAINLVPKVSFLSFFRLILLLGHHFNETAKSMHMLMIKDDLAPAYHHATPSTIMWIIYTWINLLILCFATLADCHVFVDMAAAIDFTPLNLYIIFASVQLL